MLVFTEYESFLQNIDITLEDTFMDSTFSVKNGDPYAFSVTSKPESMLNCRRLKSGLYTHWPACAGNLVRRPLISPVVTKRSGAVTRK